MKTIAFFNVKGGVGKTTAAAEAAIYAELILEANVIAIDTDINASFLDYAYDREQKHDLPYPLVTGHVQSNIDRMIKSLRSKGEYDYCVIDCHGDYDQLDKNLMYEADLIVIPVIMDIKNVRPTIKVITEKILPIVDEREGELDYAIMINNLNKRYGDSERSLIKLLEQSNLNIMKERLLKHQAKFRDVWEAGFTVIESGHYKTDPAYENAFLNTRNVVKEIFTRVNKNGN